MEILNLRDMKGGWFVGDFEPTAFKTDSFEAAYKVYPKGKPWDTHYHTVITEINLLIRGTMTIQGRTLVAGDIFILRPYEIADPSFLEDCEIICIKTPSKHDKISVYEKINSD